MENLKSKIFELVNPDWDIDIVTVRVDYEDWDTGPCHLGQQGYLNETHRKVRRWEYLDPFPQPEWLTDAYVKDCIEY
mgnify:FL=1